MSDKSTYRMPVEHLRVGFRPQVCLSQRILREMTELEGQNFFKINPSMDVPGAKDERSVPAFSPQTNGHCC
jgi:hypothetical protein